MSSVPAEELIAFLQDPQSYPHLPSRVQLIQTHISYVAITPPYVYKIKKPVNLGFLDFSTLEKRKFYCEEEIRLNRRLCGDIYESAVPITRIDGNLAFGGGGPIVEYAVKMRALEDGYFMHQLVEQGKIHSYEIDRVVERLVAFYSAQEPSHEIAEWGRIERIRLSTDENFAQTTEHIGVLLSQPAFDALRFYMRLFFDCHTLLFSRRRVEGRIIDGNGDLRLEHIHLKPDSMCIFDCIEFNKRLRYIDIANDIAFLAMDLDYHNRPDLARYFVRQMAKNLNDTELLTVLNFYKCYRAFVRGKVEGIRSTEKEVPNTERKVSRKNAQRYFQLALHYAVAGSEPLVIVMMGGVGTGKSKHAQFLSDALGWPLYSSDRTRKEMSGLAPYERSDEATRSQLYAPDMTARTYEALVEHAIEHTERRQCAILEATYSRFEHRAALREAFARKNISYRLVEITASDETIKERLRKREDATDVVSDARLEDYEKLQATYESPLPREDIFHFTVSSEGDPQDTSRSILKELIRRNA